MKRLALLLVAVPLIAHAGGSNYGITPGAHPDLSGKVRDDSPKIDEVKKRNGVAFVESFLRRGRRYNVSTDLRVIPADRFRPIRGSDFHGPAVRAATLGQPPVPWSSYEALRRRAGR